jgi:subtilisin-like proprotein convertase family protein
MNGKVLRWIIISMLPIFGLLGLFLVYKQQYVSAQDKSKTQIETEKNAVPTEYCGFVSQTLGTSPPNGISGAISRVLVTRTASAASKCGVTNAHPGVSPFGIYTYNVHNLSNPSNEPLCMTFSLYTSADLQIAAFKAPFTTSDISNPARYLGDSGQSNGNLSNIISFQTVVPANTNIAIVVFSPFSTASGQTYDYWVTPPHHVNTPCVDDNTLIPADIPENGLLIPDNTPAGIDIKIPARGVGIIREVAVSFIPSQVNSVTHPNIGDLKFTLTSPSGKSHIFQNRRGGSRDNITTSFIYDRNNFPLISSLTSVNGIPQSGVFQSELVGTRFSTFKGENGDGMWKLNVSDNAPLDSGTIFNCTLRFNASYNYPINNFGTDRKSDISTFRPSNGAWYVNQSNNNSLYAVAFGQSGDKIVPADFTGDGATDVAVFRPSNNTWYVFDTTNNTFYGIPFGTAGDIPVPEDFDGDGKDDINVFRPSTGFWYRNNSSDGTFVATPFGQNGDLPTVGNFDGDNKADIAVFRPSNGVWYRLNSKDNTFFAVQFGQTGDKVVPADYTGDYKTDIAVYRPSTGTWYILRSEDLSFYGVPFGISTDIPVPGDFDGDRKTDIAVYRSGQWFIQQSSNGFSSIPWGLAGDVPIQSAYVY